MAAFGSTNTTMNQDPKKSMKVGVIVFSIIAIICLALGIPGLTKTPKPLSDAFDGNYENGDFVEGVPAFGSTDSFTVKHTLNHIIPLMNEHYYLLASDDGMNVFFVRASKKFGENFDPDSMENLEDIEVRGAIRKFDSSIARDLQNELGGEGFSSSELTYYIDTYSNRLNVICIILGIANIALVVMSIMLFRENERKISEEYDDIPKKKSPLATVYAITIIVSMIFLLYVMLMRF